MPIFFHVFSVVSETIFLVIRMFANICEEESAYSFKMKLNIDLNGREHTM